MNEICRALDKSIPADKVTFFALHGFETLSRVFQLVLEQKSSCVIPLKSVATCCKTWALACKGHKANTEFVLKSNMINVLVDILADRMDVLLPNSNDEIVADLPPKGPQVDPLAKSIMWVLAQIFEDLSQFLKSDTNRKPIDQSKPEDLNVRLQDQVSYIVSICMIDKLSDYLTSVQDPIDHDPDLGDFLLRCLQFMSSLAKVAEILTSKPEVAKSNSKSVTNSTPGCDPTYLLLAYEVIKNF